MTVIFSVFLLIDIHSVHSSFAWRTPHFCTLFLYIFSIDLLNICIAWRNGIESSSRAEQAGILPRAHHGRRRLRHLFVACMCDILLIVADIFIASPFYLIFAFAISCLFAFYKYLCIFESIFRSSTRRIFIFVHLAEGKGGAGGVHRASLRARAAGRGRRDVIWGGRTLNALCCCCARCARGKAGRPLPCLPADAPRRNDRHRRLGGRAWRCSSLNNENSKWRRAHLAARLFIRGMSVRRVHLLFAPNNLPYMVDVSLSSIFLEKIKC